MKVIAAKTGYEVEMIDLEMDMEVELGIDSIKRVEILSEVQKQLGIEVQNVAALSRTKTVEKVIDHMGTQITPLPATAAPTPAASAAGAAPGAPLPLQVRDEEQQPRAAPRRAKPSRAKPSQWSRAPR